MTTIMIIMSNMVKKSIQVQVDKDIHTRLVKLRKIRTDRRGSIETMSDVIERAVVLLEKAEEEGEVS